MLKSKKITGQTIYLELMSNNHYDGLFNASNDDQVWTYSSTGKNPEDRFDKWFQNLSKKNTQNLYNTYTIIDQETNNILGSTSYYDILDEHKSAQIGYTWYTRSVWGSYVNVDCKLALLRFAFEEVNYNRIAFSVDSRNERSLTALKKLGATKEGVLRKHLLLPCGYVRDTVRLSIIKSEWPKVKKSLIQRFEEKYSKLNIQKQKVNHI